MTEVEREAILYERARQRQAAQEKRELKAKLERSAGQLEERETRMKRTLAGHTINARTMSTRHEASSEEEGQESELEASDVYDEDQEDEPGDTRGPRKTKGHQEMKVGPENLDSTDVPFALLQRLYLARRHVLAWLYRPYFNTETLAGLFVRLIHAQTAAGQSIYRLYRVEAVEPGATAYSFNADGKRYTTLHRLVVSYGALRRSIKLEGLANSALQPHEAERWKANMVAAKLRLPSVAELEAIAKRFEALQQRPVTNDEIAHMVALKKQLNVLHMNPGVLKTVLLRDLDDARLRGDEEAVLELESQIAQLGDVPKAATGSNEPLGDSLDAHRTGQETDAQVAKRSRLTKEQVDALFKKNALETAAAVKPTLDVNVGHAVALSLPDDAMNPFARRKTRSTFTQALMKGRSVAISNSNQVNDGADAVSKEQLGKDVSSSSVASHHSPTDASLATTNHQHNPSMPSAAAAAVDLDDFDIEISPEVRALMKNRG